MIDILNILAWPATVLVLALVFRRPLTAAMSRVSALGFDGFSVHFERLIAPAEKAFAGPDRGHVDDARERRLHRLERLAEQAPRAAILEAWADLAQAQHASRRSAGIAEVRSNQADAQAIAALADIRDRALAASDRTVGYARARRYVRLAWQAGRRLDEEGA